MNGVVNNFLLARDKFMSELHLKQPGFTFSVCGPFTKKKDQHIQLVGPLVIEGWQSMRIHQFPISNYCNKKVRTRSSRKQTQSTIQYSLVTALLMYIKDLHYIVY